MIDPNSFTLLEEIQYKLCAYRAADQISLFSNRLLEVLLERVQNRLDLRVAQLHQLLFLTVYNIAGRLYRKVVLLY